MFFMEKLLFIIMSMCTVGAILVQYSNLTNIDRILFLFVSVTLFFVSRKQYFVVKSEQERRSDWWYEKDNLFFPTRKYLLKNLIGKPPTCPECQKKMLPLAVLVDGEGWSLNWDCQTEEHRGRVYEWMDYKELEIDWPYPVNAIKHIRELEEAGFETFIS